MPTKQNDPSKDHQISSNIKSLLIAPTLREIAAVLQPSTIHKTFKDMTVTTSSTSSIVVVPPVVAELSRSYKYNDHILVKKNDKKTTTRKRPRKDEHADNDSSPSRSSSSLQSQSQSQSSPLVNNSNTNNCCCCFEVRSCPTKNNQNGIFATQNIACGDLIIAHEDPIVSSTEQRSSSTFCHGCATPIGSLKDHILAAAAANTAIIGTTTTTTTTTKTKEILFELPDLPCGLLKNEHGPMFSSNNSSSSTLSYRCNIEECGCKKNVVWCSTQCRDKTTGNGGNQQQHAFDYVSPTTAVSTTEQNNAINNFYKGVTHPMAFQMAAQSITLILSTILNKFIMKANQINLNNENENEYETTTTKTIDNDDDVEDLDPLLEHDDDDDDDDLRQYYWWNDYGSHPLWWEVGSKSQSKQRKEQTDTFCHLFELHLLKSIKQRRFAASSSSLLDNENNGGNNVKSNDEILVQLEKLLKTAVKALCTIDHIGSILGFDWLADHNVHNSDMNGPVIGSGLYPLLTLANHDCTPNASIEFLQESNRGSMVALRDIVVGEEICLSYIPSNEDEVEEGNDTNDSQVTRHFKPTRTEIWLGKQNKITESGSTSTQQQRQENDDDDDDDGVTVNQDSPEANHITGSDGDDDDDDDDIILLDDEFSTAKAERARAIQEYGFECHCQRCKQ
ncbi:hypothetical protein FRACYDRAFT_236655 [Fragilariopsis cylindrus CCMP1102]|uniref:SET domain-containing protein n=1 Tax=Fragilariopsis cylindrus CCMP1102 TaxID=635003 RepID=A0A1E7FJP4_9STRA|nr:hypothetical protein FRACYDRAFT_236655 [Fragilariopsis cylindrus CCMP1102]|eukprot:OEU18378.1 hypothetical protein FRACYDRAFT_236655 [Fragilariopsis cylindrus CCMP1102]